MRAVRIAAGLLFCLALTACGLTEKWTDPTAAQPPTAQQANAPVSGGSRADPYPIASNENEKVLRGQDALQAMRARNGTGGEVNSITSENGKMTVKTQYPDGSSMSIISGDNGNQIEFRPGTAPVR